MSSGVLRGDLFVTMHRKCPSAWADQNKKMLSSQLAQQTGPPQVPGAGFEPVGPFGPGGGSSSHLGHLRGVAECQNVTCLFGSLRLPCCCVGCIDGDTMPGKLDSIRRGVLAFQTPSGQRTRSRYALCDAPPLRPVPGTVEATKARGDDLDVYRSAKRGEHGEFRFADTGVDRSLDHEVHA